MSTSSLKKGRDALAQVGRTLAYRASDGNPAVEPRPRGVSFNICSPTSTIHKVPKIATIWAAPTSLMLSSIVPITTEAGFDCA
jgi:hypothetical protein